MGQTVSGYRLVTTEKLVGEGQSEDLQDKYPKLAETGIQKELKAAALKFPPRQKKLLHDDTEDFRKQANVLVEAHCLAQKTEKMRKLSYVDASLWATAVHVGGSIASDEWPLAFAAQRLPYDDDGNCIEVVTSMHVLHMLETAGKLDPKGRWNMVRQWRRAGEGLHRDADKHYRELFGEKPPTKDSPPR